MYIDEPYNIFHSLLLAAQLDKSEKVDVEILATPRNIEFLESFPDIVTGLKITCIRPHWYITLPHLIEIKLQFRSSLFIKYRKYLCGFDAIVCSLYNDAELKKRLEAQYRPKLIFAGHGVANRSYSYNDAITAFDLILLAGNREKIERTQRRQLTPQNHLLTGYIKHELCETLDSEGPFPDAELVVLYNPHWLKEYSSFYQYGFDILDFFANQDRYKLIFAPHQLLTVRNKGILRRLRQYTSAESIYIDLDSPKLSDMTYTKVADLYLGDISSQALEFMLQRPRPCVFFKPTSNNAPKDEEFHTWEGGEVLDHLGNVEQVIMEAIHNFKTTYHSKQVALVKDLFHVESRSSSRVAAEGILNYLLNQD